MKFNKTLRAQMTKYKHIIPNQYWFEYKDIKKIIKQLSNYNSYNQKEHETNECCICLDSRNLMSTFCCNQPIHHECLIRCILSNNVSPICPLCRQDMMNYFQNASMIKDLQHKHNLQIISMLGKIHLNILKIENVYNKLQVKKKIVKTYVSYNHKAILKICKKIKKHLHHDFTRYFQEIMAKNNIICQQPIAKSSFFTFFHILSH